LKYREVRRAQGERLSEQHQHSGELNEQEDSERDIEAKHHRIASIRVSRIQ